MEYVAEIGKIKLRKINEKGQGLLEAFTEDVSGNGKYKNALEITIEKSQQEFLYKYINFKQYDENDKSKYLYRSGSPRGSDVTPTSKLTDIEKTLPNKIITSVLEATKFGKEKFKEEKEYLKDIYEVLEKNKDFIKNDIKNLTKDIPKKEGCFLTVVLQENGQKKYIGDFALFKEKIVKNALKKFHYSETYKKDVYKEKGKCSICTNDKEDIYGLVGIFPFYTIDKPGYISGGFTYEKAWRNYPVCKECAIALELGKKYLDDNLIFTFYGRRYYLIPKPIYGEKLEEILKKYKSLKSEDIKETGKKYAYIEERILRILSSENDFINFELMFIEEKNSALKILLNIEDISPSRFSKIFNALDKIRQMELFEDKQVSFEIINSIFPRRVVNGKIIENAYFIDTIDKIISNKKIEYKFIMRFLNEYIIDAYKRYEKDEFIKGVDNYNQATFRVFGFLYFLQYLNLFTNRKEALKMELNKNIWDIEDYTSKKELFESFFEESQPFFNNADKKAVFLIGYITKKLLNIQYAKEKRKPFMSRLKGLKLNKREIRRLIPEIQAKLVEYRSQYYDEIFNIISQYIIESNELKNLAELDIPFYFSIGMNMDKNFKISTKEEISTDSDEE